MAWIDGLFQSETVPLLEASLGFAHQKQLAIMNNIANVDTPYYKRQDVAQEQFMTALQDAIDERRQRHPNRFQLRESSDIRVMGSHYPVARARPGREFGPERHDENSVVPEKEMAELAKNTMMIESMQRLLKKKLDLLRSSLRDRVV